MSSEQKPPAETRQQPLTGNDTYHLVSDVVVGPNVRLKDNLYQGLAIFICLVLGVVVGLLTATDRILGAVLGGFIGLLAGLFGSGIFLMIFRAIRHARGRHD